MTTILQKAHMSSLNSNVPELHLRILNSQEWIGLGNFARGRGVPKPATWLCAHWWCSDSTSACNGGAGGTWTIHMFKRGCTLLWHSGDVATQVPKPTNCFEVKLHLLSPLTFFLWVYHFVTTMFHWRICIFLLQQIIMSKLLYILYKLWAEELSDQSSNIW